jgi:uncharacterized protein YciI
MEFDRLTASLLVLRDDAPRLGQEDADALQNAHMAYLAGLHDRGVLLAAGPLDDAAFRGLSILRAEPAEALRLAEQDPAVIAGRFRVQILPWKVPVGAIAFSRTTFPRSMREAQ